MFFLISKIHHSSPLFPPSLVLFSAVALLVGEKVQEETTLVDDPFQMKTGGMVDMKKLKERGKDKISDEEDLHLGTSFSAETNRRDEDADMMKYIETELKKRKGIVEHEEQKVKQQFTDLISFV